MRLVYRGDTRPPSQVFNLGFTPRFSGGIKIQNGGQMIGGISTSKEISIAMDYAARYEGYVYALFSDDNAIDVVDELIRKNLRDALPNAYTQMEIACNAVRPNQIIMARPVVMDSSQKYINWTKSIERNPHFSRSGTSQELATADYLFPPFIAPETAKTTTKVY